jgi:hypothetical protein
MSPARLSDAQRLLRQETESEFSSWVIDVAHLHGWRVAHFRPALTQRGWRTPVQADGRGFPDLILLHPDGAGVAAEVKREAAPAPTIDQKAWLEAFGAAGFAAVVWRPRDRPTILATLSRRASSNPPTEA